MRGRLVVNEPPTRPRHAHSYLEPIRPQLREAVMRRLCLGLVCGFVVSACGGGGDGTGPTPNTIAVSAGNNHVGAAGAALAESLAVIARDPGRAPLAHATVALAVAAGGGSHSSTFPGIHASR